MKSIILSQADWLRVYNQIARDYPPSILLIRNRMREVLGFTSRTHEEWIDQEVDLKDIRYGTKYSIITIHLDFWDEKKKAFFLLKYSDLLKNSS
jgi:hypothetical protein